MIWSDESSSTIFSTSRWVNVWCTRRKRSKPEWFINTVKGPSGSVMCGRGELCWHCSDPHVTNQYKGVQNSQRLWEIFDQRVDSVLSTTTTIKTPYLEIRDLQHWSCSGSTKWPNTFLKHFMLVFPLIRHSSVFPPVKPTVPAPLCLSSFHKPRWTTTRGQRKKQSQPKVTHWLPAPRGHLYSKEMISIRRWATLNPQTVEPIICTSYKSWRKNKWGSVRQYGN